MKQNINFLNYIKERKKMNKKKYIFHYVNETKEKAELKRLMHMSTINDLTNELIKKCGDTKLSGVDCEGKKYTIIIEKEQ